MIIKRILLTWLIFASLPTLAYQQRIAYINNAGVRASVGVVNLDKEAAALTFIDEQAIYWKLGWEQQKNSWLFGGGISGYLYSDDAEFTQLTESLIGDSEESESKATSFNLYLESGYNYRVHKRLNLAFLFGYEHVINSDRSIDFCDDCYSEDIEIEAGVYAHPRATYSWSRDWFSALGYNAYFSGEVKNSVYLTLGAYF